VRNLGFRWKRGIKRLNRIDPVARAEFAEKIQQLADEANRGERTLIYVDEAHIHCDLDEGYGWALGSEAYEISSSSPALSKKVSLYGALVFNDPQVVLWKAPRCNTMFTLAYLFQLARIVADKPKPTIVWDGAPWHRPLYMRTVAEKVLGFEIVQLPAYSPDFMPVEALWRWLREEVTRNYCHNTVEELVVDIIEFGKCLNADPLGLITRLWPKLELREDERPEALPLPSEGDASEQATATWRPPPSTLPESLLTILALGPSITATPQPAEIRLTHAEWERVRRVIPKRNRKGRPQRDPRQMVEAILWLERTGAPGRQLPASYGPRQTVYARYAQWRESGTWADVLQALQAEPQTALPLSAVCSLKRKAV
jgi:transposase